MSARWTVIETHFKSLTLIRRKGHYCIKPTEVPGPVIDIGEEQELREIGLVVEIDDKVLTRGSGAGPVVCIQRNIREAIHCAERVTKGLYHGLAAVAEPDHASQIEIHILQRTSTQGGLHFTKQPATPCSGFALCYCSG